MTPTVGELPITIQTMSFNIYALSVIYFRDHHSPIPQQVLNDILKMIARQFHGISVDVLKTPSKLGGFGLIDLEKQLLGHRAKMVYNIICDSHYYAYISFKDKLQHLATIITNIFHLHPSQRIVHVPIGKYGHSARDPDGNLLATEESSYNNGDNLLPQAHSSDGTQVGFPFYQLLDGSFLDFYHKLPHSSLFRKQVEQVAGPENRIKTIMELLRALPKIKLHHQEKKALRLSTYFSDAQIAQLEAWFQVVHPADSAGSLDYFRLKESSIYRKFIKSGHQASKAIHLQVLDIKEEKLTVDSFKHFHKKFYEEKGNARTTTVFSTPSSNHQLLQTKVLSTFKWETFWLQLYKHQTQRPGYLEALQRFNLGHYKYKFPISPHHQQFPDKPFRNLLLMW